MASPAAGEALEASEEDAAGRDGDLLVHITRNWCFTCISAKRATVSLSETAIEAEVDSLAVTDQQEALDRAQAVRNLVDELPDVT